MNRTITLATLDHGTVTVPEPGWCTGHADHRPCHLVDLTHTGSEHRFAFDGDDLLVAMFSQHPHATQQRTGVLVEQTGWARTLDYAGLRQLAAALTVHAMHLRTLADQLAAIQAEEGGK
ncbi:DUF6907 domain-containing protein [Streptomyces sp. NPDC090303]|uniref:DUF6907 domain-containing protein n=1 Tax=Streptomyces sp. NPDC090303 TaxID=3365960 RepID=UPI0037F7C910